ncbi:MAG: hypothetical protein II309_01265 [Bacilli bacterium]|nr:hypothetical protein [Bacilli bacterium]
MLGIFNNLSSGGYVVLALIALILIIGGIVLIVYLNNKNKNTDKIIPVTKDNNIPDAEKKPDIQIALATNDIPEIENKIEKNNEETNIDKEENTSEKEIENEEKKPDIQISLATNDIPEIENKVEKNNEETEIDKEENTLKKEEADINQEEIEEKKENKDDIESNVDSMEENLMLNELEMMQDNKNKTNIEEVLKAMQIDLEKQKYAKIDAYEEEQEEEAVISYQELRKKMAMKEEKKKEEKLESIIKPTANISIDDYLTFNTPAVNEVKESSKPLYEELETKKDDYSSYFFDILDKNESRKEEPVEELKFYNEEPLFYDVKPQRYKESYVEYSDDYISPVFGRQKTNVVYNDLTKIRENKKAKETIINNLDETNEFLNTLKEFRNNL